MELTTDEDKLEIQQDEAATKQLFTEDELTYGIVQSTTQQEETNEDYRIIQPVVSHVY